MRFGHPHVSCLAMDSQGRREAVSIERLQGRVTKRARGARRAMETFDNLKRRSKTGVLLDNSTLVLYSTLVL
jgi:hypothetical protein